MSTPIYHRLVQLAEMALPTGVSDKLRQRVREQRSARNAARLAERLAWWDGQPADGSSTTVELQPDVRMQIYFGGELSRFIFQGNFEAEERVFLNAFLRPGDTFVDIGANLGLFSLIAAHLVGPRGHVHAFEPCAQTCERLQKNVALNRFKNVAVHALALSDSAGPREMVMAVDGMDAWNSLAQPYMGGNYTTETITTDTWDSFAEAHGLASGVALMKIDVEGWEAPVLAGARRMLSKPDAPVLQVEFTDAAAKAAGHSCADVYRMLEEFGYRVYRFDPVERQLIHDPIRAEYPYLNLFAVKDLAAALPRLQRP
jgi:FkbM family methyltransferase